MDGAERKRAASALAKGPSASCAQEDMPRGCPRSTDGWDGILGDLTVEDGEGVRVPEVPWGFAFMVLLQSLGLLKTPS